MFFTLPHATQVSLQTPQSHQMDLIVSFYNNVTFFLIFILVFVSYMLVIILSKASLQRSESKIVIGHLLETIWTITPSVLLGIIAIPSFTLLYALDNNLNPDISVKIIGRQWYWTYEYINASNTPIIFDAYMISEEDLTIGFRLLEVVPLILPNETNIRLIITSSDVLHSWAVPSLGIKMDAVPGRLNAVHLTTTYAESIAYGQCSELCGSLHGFMPIKVQVPAVDRLAPATWIWTGESTGLCSSYIKYPELIYAETRPFRKI
jgi:heme/copper-type cytochrome/quinol oxidase subunit 2